MKGRYLAMGLLCVAVSACTSPAEREAPPELIGIWKTQAPGYEDCELEIEAKRITFSKGLTHADMNRICRVKSVTSGAVRGYEIRYEDTQGQAYTLIGKPEHLINKYATTLADEGNVSGFRPNHALDWKKKTVHI